MLTTILTLIIDKFNSLSRFLTNIVIQVHDFMLRVTDDHIISHEVDNIFKTNVVRNDYFVYICIQFFSTKNLFNPDFAAR